MRDSGHCAAAKSEARYVALLAPAS